MTIDREIIDEMKELAKREVTAVNPKVFQDEEKALYAKTVQKYGQEVATELLRKLWKIVGNERKNRRMSEI